MNILDDNFLACSEDHIRAVFAMLKNQRMGRVQLTGGLEAARLRDWHIDLLLSVKPKQVFFAYDTPNDWSPLVDAAARLFDAGMSRASKCLRAYVLIGYPGDTLDRAEARLQDTLRLGVIPMAMLWKNDAGDADPDWKRLQCMWARPAYMKVPKPQSPQQESGEQNEQKLHLVSGVPDA